MAEFNDPLVGGDDVENEATEQSEREIGRIFQSALASVGRTISLSATWELKRKAFRNGLAEALTFWNGKGINQSEILDEFQDLAEAKDLLDQFGQDEIQRDMLEEIQALQAKKQTNGNGEAKYDYRDEETDDVGQVQQEPQPAEAPPPLEPLPFFSIQKFEGLTPRERGWLVRNRVPMRNVSLLGGDGAAGKTTIALQLACAVVTGTPWLNGDVTQQGRVMFLTAEEEEDEIHRRLDWIRSYNGWSFNQLADVHAICLPGQNSVLAALDHKSGLLKATKLYGRMTLSIQNIRPSLIVVETAADVFAGNENDRSQVRQFISTQLRAWCLIDGAALLLLSHPSQAGRRSGGESGSTGWNNSSRARLYLSKIKADTKEEVEDDDDLGDIRVLEVMKTNYAREGEKIELAWTEGLFVPVSSLKAKTLAKVDPVVVENRAKNAEAAFLACLDVRNSRKQFVNQLAGSRSRYAPKVFAEMSEAGGFKEKALTDAMNRLIDKGTIRVEQWGSPSKRIDYLIRAQPNMPF